MNTASPTLTDHLRSGILLPVLLLVFLAFVSCGSREKVIPKEETGEPNTVPEEIQRYRDAREVFRTWVEMFQRPRNAEAAFPLMTTASRKRLAARGIKSASAFADWVHQQDQRGIPPFTYEFSRFDILDIDVRDSVRAIVTATFLVHVHQNTFESVSSFILQREKGSWRVPFAESANFESSWWQKEKNFLSRMASEGLSNYTSDTLGITFSYPQAWDVNSGVSLELPGHPAENGIELRYIDPSTLATAALIRIVPLPPVQPDSLDSPDSVRTGVPKVLRTDQVKISDELPMHGTQSVLLDPVSGRRLLFLAAVTDAGDDPQRFADTFRAVRTSILFNNEDMP